jgi:hypothetical protein
MGGLYAGLAEAAEKVGSKLIGKEAGEMIERGVYRGIYSDERAFAQHPYAKKIYEDIQNVYKPKLNQFQGEIATASQKAGAVKSPSMIYSEAAQKASDHTFGSKQVRLQAMLKAVEKDKGKHAAGILSDDLQVMLQQAPLQEGGAKGQSMFDINMARGGEAAAPNVPPAKYKPRNAAEKAVSGLRGMLAWKAAPIHATMTALNVASDSGLKNLAGTLSDIWGPSREGAIAQLKESNAIAEFTLHELRQHESFQQGIISKYADNSVGEFVHRNMYIPGMDAVRRESILVGAYSGKRMAEEAALRLQHGDEKWALQAFHHLGIDANEVKRDGFKLSQDNVRKAFYHGANNQVFLSPYDATPSFWRQSPLWRSIKAFSGYVTSQNKFERQLIMRQYRNGDFIGIARNVAMKSLAYPLVGATLFEFERLLTGNDWDDPYKHWENRLEYTPAGQVYDTIQGKNNANQFMRSVENTLDMVAKLGVFGSTAGYVQAANRQKLQNRFLPPEIGIATQLGEDALGALPTAKHPSAKPLGRDILSEIPIIGGPLSHKLLPTKAEQNAKKPKHFRIRRKPPTYDNFQY